ncbi:probable ATP-dependent RNA helicase DDX46 [Watersipora subatra]|uniref:probable ATP-dependent RNA helicase DDX46 n=1 Tax=Watersipora subatra TaxID=2589382 RepID=UPI00355B9C43
MESGFSKLVFGEHGDGSWERFIEEMNLCIDSAVKRRGYVNDEDGNRVPIMRGRARDKGGDVGYDRRGSSRRSGGSRDNSYERYGSRDSSRERYRGRKSPREMRDKSSRYRDKSMDRFEGEKYKERRETSRESEVKKGHTGQDWWACKTKGVKSSKYVEIGSQRETAQGIRDVQVSMGYDREHSHDEVREGAEKEAEPVSVMEKVCSFLAEVSSKGMLDREGHEKKVAEIERAEREVRRKSKEKLAMLKAKRETAVMELENVKAFRVVVQKLAEVQRRIAGNTEQELRSVFTTSRAEEIKDKRRKEMFPVEGDRLEKREDRRLRRERDYSGRGSRRRSN